MSGGCLSAIIWLVLSRSLGIGTEESVNVELNIWLWGNGASFLKDSWVEHVCDLSYFSGRMHDRYLVCNHERPGLWRCIWISHNSIQSLSDLINGWLSSFIRNLIGFWTLTSHKSFISFKRWDYSCVLLSTLDSLLQRVDLILRNQYLIWVVSKVVAHLSSFCCNTNIRSVCSELVLNFELVLPYNVIELRSKVCK